MITEAIRNFPMHNKKMAKKNNVCFLVIIEYSINYEFCPVTVIVPLPS